MPHPRKPGAFLESDFLLYAQGCLFAVEIKSLRGHVSFAPADGAAGPDRTRIVQAKPVSYPVAGNPQAWAAAATPHMLTSLLGLRPDGVGPRLDICQARLPDWLDWVVRRLRVGGREVDVCFDRAEDDALAQTRNPADLEVAVRY